MKKLLKAAIHEAQCNMRSAIKLTAELQKKWAARGGST
jgi:hypothetical protein